MAPHARKRPAKSPRKTATRNGSNGTQPDERELTPKQAAFVEEYLLDLNATQAAIRSGYSPKTANEQGARLLANASVRASVAEGKATRSVRTGITADMVLERWWELATADPRELVEYRRTACRHCYGAEYEYQLTPNERRRRSGKRPEMEDNPDTDRREETRYLNGGRVVPPGEAWLAIRDPNPTCPECFGHGIDRLYVHDTRKLTPSASRLYAGVKQTKDGIEVRMRDQDAALANIAKHLGMFTEKHEHTGADGTPLTITVIRRVVDAKANGSRVRV